MIINKIDKYYLNYNKCMKLKERGFDVYCNKFYGHYPHHNGEPLGSDEEYELRSEGKGNEITYEIINQTLYNKNSELNKESCSCPEINTVIDWIFENLNIVLTVIPYWNEDELAWLCKVNHIKDGYIELMKTLLPFDNRYKAYAEGIKWTLDNINNK